MTDSASKKSLSVIFIPDPSAYMPCPAKTKKKNVCYAIKLTDASNVMTDSASKNSLSVIFMPKPSAYMPHPAKTKKKKCFARHKIDGCVKCNDGFVII